MFEEFLFDLRALRKRSGLTQADCAHLLGTSNQTVSQIELGERIPSAREICALSVIFGSSFESFYAENMHIVRSLLTENLESIPGAPEGWLATKPREATLGRLANHLETELPDIV